MPQDLSQRYVTEETFLRVKLIYKLHSGDMQSCQ